MLCYSGELRGFGAPENEVAANHLSKLAMPLRQAPLELGAIAAAFSLTKGEALPEAARKRCVSSQQVAAPIAAGVAGCCALRHRVHVPVYVQNMHGTILFPNMPVPFEHTLNTP